MKNKTDADRFSTRRRCIVFKKKFLTLLLLLSLSALHLIANSFLFAEESITITTYYPSPYGVYKTLRLYPYHDDTHDSGDACTNQGEMYFNDSDGKLYVCGGTTTLTWQPVGDGGYRTYTRTGTTDCYPGDTALMYRTVPVTCSDPPPSVPFCLTCTTSSHDWDSSPGSLETCTYQHKFEPAEYTPYECVDATCYASPMVLCRD
jgi:hypothetical protein